jgi:crossover junction endodeoxyribonuclease RuvC
MIILGIDPGFARMGVAVLEKNKKGKESLIFSTCVETDKKEKQERRLLSIGKELEKIISKYKPDVLAIEKLFFAQNTKTALQVSEAVGVILYVCASKNIPVYEFTPLQIKIALTGYGKAEKRQVEDMAQAILKLEKMPKLDDETDAIAVSLTCASSLNSLKLKG